MIKINNNFIINYNAEKITDIKQDIKTYSFLNLIKYKTIQ